MATKINASQIRTFADLTALTAGSVAGADSLIIDDAGTKKKLTITELLSYINTNATVSASSVDLGDGDGTDDDTIKLGASDDLLIYSDGGAAGAFRIYTDGSEHGYFQLGGNSKGFNFYVKDGSGTQVTGLAIYSYGVTLNSTAYLGISSTQLQAGELDQGSGDFTMDIDGDLELNADGGQITMKDGSASHFLFDMDNTAFTIYDDQDDGDLFKIQVAQHGATTISTVDDDATAADLTLDPDGDLILDAGATSQIILKENGTAFLQLSASSGDAVVANEAAGKDIIFMAHPDGGNSAQVARIDASASSFLIQSGKELQFADEAEHISSDGSTLSIVSEDGSIAVGTSLADAQTISIGPAAATQLVLSPHGTAGSEKISLVNKSGTADDAIKIDAEAGGLTLAAGNDSLILDADGTDADAINIDSAGGIDIDATTAINIATSDAAGDITLASAHTAGVAIHLDGNAAAGSIVDIDAGILDVDVTGVASIDSGGTLSLGTANSGVAVSIGHTTSETTVNDNLTVTGNATVSGNLTVNGTTTTVNSSTLTVDDPLIFLGGSSLTGSDNSDGLDRGMLFSYYNANAGAVHIGGLILERDVTDTQSSGRFALLGGAGHSESGNKVSVNDNGLGELSLKGIRVGGGGIGIAGSITSSVGTLVTTSGANRAASGIVPATDTFMKVEGGAIKFDIGSKTADTSTKLTASADSIAVYDADAGASKRVSLATVQKAIVQPVRDVFFSGAVGNIGGTTDDGDQAITSGSMTADLLTASLSAVAYHPSSIQVYLNGLLLAPSGSLANDSGSFAATDFDYRFATSDDTGGGDGDSNAGGEVLAAVDISGQDQATATAISHIFLKTALDSDDILTVHYLRV